MNTIAQLLNIFLLIFFVSIIFSWIPTTPGTFLHQIKTTLYQITDPVLRPIRQVIKPVRIGGAYLDLSPLVVFLGLEILIGLLRS